MSTLRIPERLFNGFAGLSEIQEETFISLVEFIKNTEFIEDIQEFGMEMKSLIKHENSKTIVDVILSLGSIRSLYPDDDIAAELGLSFSELDVKNQYNYELLKDRLAQLLKWNRSIVQHYKRDKLLSSNENILDEIEIVTDIRLLFDEDIQSKNRQGLIFHKMKIDYISSKEEKEMYFALDRNDLINFKKIIDRAIEKEKAIVEDYKDTIEFRN